MTKAIAGFAAALIALAILDGVWLGLVSREFYKARIGQLLLDQPVWSIAILFYLIHAVGISVFPVQMAASWKGALLYGALFGFFAYSAYDITNLATLRGWSMTLSLVDLAWGTFATAMAATASFLTVRALS